MTARREIHAIFESVRKTLVIGREWGIDPPTLSPSALEFLEGKQATQTPSTLEGLRDLIGDCRRCRLWSGRRNLVFGEGSPSARLVFIGEAPGNEEDESGRPFMGEAGKLLTRIIQDGMRLRREEVYICNVVKCRPPGDRPVQRDEFVSCLPFLMEQLRIIRPEIICTLGGPATGVLTGGECEISKERGTWTAHESIPLMPTLHPATILSRPQEERILKGLVWKDVQQIMKRLGMNVGK